MLRSFLFSDNKICDKIVIIDQIHSKTNMAGFGWKEDIYACSVYHPPLLLHKVVQHVQPMA